MNNNQSQQYSCIDRRTAIQAGAIGMGLSTFQLASLRSLAGAPESPKAKSVIFIFLTGGLSQHDSFDMKPNAPVEIRGEFKPISTKTPGLQICEHLPMLAQRSEQYALLRSMQTASSGHELACHMMLTGRRDLPAAFSLDRVPSQNEWPSIPAVTTYAMRHQRVKMPPAVVLPEPSVNEVGKMRPGQYAGLLGSQWDAWHLDIAAKCTLGNGACPDCFRFEGTPFQHGSETVFDTPSLKLPTGGQPRFQGRIDLLANVQQQQRELERVTAKLDSQRQQAISILTDSTIKSAFNVENADVKTVERYGKNKFGLSLLMALRLIESGVKLVQVNLGKNSTWDTHRRNFANLKENLLPPMDRCVSALLDDLAAKGLLDETLVIMTGEFGRTPIINKDAGRDHWALVNTVLFAGGGVRGGNIIGASDKIAAEPISHIQTPETFSATIYDALGIPRDALWKDIVGRPHKIYHANPIEGLM